MHLVPIGYLRSPFAEKFGTPRQPGLVPGVESVVELASPWDNGEAVRGLEGFSHVWLLFGFHLNEPGRGGRSTVRPPRLGGNERVGVFATRSPYRPNPLGLSLVKLCGVFPDRIVVSGADGVDGTPVYDIKPWLGWADRPGAGEEESGGFAGKAPGGRLEVTFGPGLEGHRLAGELERILGLDPRPAYRRDDGGREYGLTYAGHEIRWRVDDGGACLQVIAIEESIRKKPE
ncbi:MAG: tRNA (N6-threonylcarbamoyladenosine(37)-N6)-methyltransferase TrmO [Verrucomicrobia bacterium]|nr:tRNA (N6-threonylcarbamoyladenosine(37)-N6)-methyltransferase TrmO [Verrucomicrobiota bacterium]